MKYEYSLKNGGAVITGYSGSETDILIPDELDGHPVIEIGEGAFLERKNTWGKGNRGRVTVGRLVLPASVRVIQSKAFSGICARELVLPAELTQVSKDAFFPFDGPETLFLPDGLDDFSAFSGIGSLAAFQVSETNPCFSARDGILYAKDGKTLLRCPISSSIKCCRISEGVETIARGAFSDCRGIEQILIPESVRHIGANAFENCVALSDIRLPDALISLGGGAFSHCGLLEQVTVPAGVKRIEDNSFYHCSRLKSIVLPDSVTFIGKDAFTLCRSLQTVLLPPGLTEISDRCFLYCSALSEIELPEGVISVGEEAFANCSSLKRVELHRGVLRLGSGAFARCGQLREIALPDTLEEIGREAFTGCGIKTLSIPRSVRSFDEWFNISEPITLRIQGISIDAIRSPEWKAAAAWGYINILLTGGVLPADIDESYKKYVRENCSRYYPDALKNRDIMRCLMQNCLIPLRDIDALLKQTEDMISVRAELLQYRRDHFTTADFDRLAEEEIERQLRGPTAAELQKIWQTSRTADGTYALTSYRGTDLEILVPEKIGKVPVTEISHDCFSPWKVGLDDAEIKVRENILSVYMPDSVTVIEAGAFRGCESLEKVRISSRLKRIGDCAFSQCSSLAKAALPESIDDIGEAVFLDCRSLADQEGFVIIHKCLFAYCGKARDVVIPEGVEVISAKAFENNGTITTVSFPSTLRRIGEYAFNMCQGLREIDIPGNVEWIERGAFFACTAVEKLRVREGVSYIDDIAFRYGSSLSRIWFPASLREIGVNAIADCDWPIVYSPKNSIAEKYAKMYYLRTSDQF